MNRGKNEPCAPCGGTGKTAKSYNVVGSARDLEPVGDGAAKCYACGAPVRTSGPGESNADYDCEMCGFSHELGRSLNQEVKEQGK